MKKHYLITYMFHVKETNNTTYGHCIITMPKLKPHNFDNLIDFVQKNYCNNQTAIIQNIYKF